MVPIVGYLARLLETEARAELAGKSSFPAVAATAELVGSALDTAAVNRLLDEPEGGVEHSIVYHVHDGDGVLGVRRERAELAKVAFELAKARQPGDAQPRRPDGGNLRPLWRHGRRNDFWSRPPSRAEIITAGGWSGSRRCLLRAFQWVRADGTPPRPLLGAARDEAECDQRLFFARR